MPICVRVNTKLSIIGSMNAYALETETNIPWVELKRHIYYQKGEERRESVKQKPETDKDIIQNTTIMGQKLP